MTTKQEREIPGITRRKFLEWVVASTVVATLGEIGTGCKPIPKEISKESLEREFNIRLLTGRELYEEKGLAYPQAGGEGDYNLQNNLYKHEVPLFWDNQRLTSLRAILRILPPEFYKPKEDGERLTIVLSNRDCQCGAEYGESSPYRVEFSYNRFLEIKMEDLSVVAHELTHVQTPISGYRFFWSQVERKDRRVEESPWYDRINQILGVQDVFEARDKLGARFRKNTEELYNQLSFPMDHTDIDKLPFEERERYYFYERLIDVLWYPYKAISEFVAFLSENYVKGRAYFDRRVGELFSEEEYQKIYNFVRDEIFHGREYPVP